MATDKQAFTRFEALFREHHPAVQAYARRRVPAELVDDVVSETFLVAWRRMDSVPHQALPWLLGVARNVAGTERRGQTRRQRLWEKARADHSEVFEPGTQPPEGDGAILAALARLSERDREALTLVAWDGLTPTQAAAVLNESPNRFRVRLHRASRRLRALLGSDLHQESSASSPPPLKPSSKGAALS